MPQFKFKAEKPNGEVYEGKRSAPDKFALYREIKAEGDTVISTKEETEKKSIKVPLLNFFSRVSMHDRILFARNIGLMLEAGLPLSRALSVIERQTPKKNYKKIIGKIGSEISQGRSLSDALTLYPAVFSKLFVSMVRAGEESGSLPKTLKSISNQMMSTYLLQKKVRGAMIYPAIIVGVIIIISFLMLTYVVPTLTAVFADLKLDLPWNTKLIIFASNAMKEHTILFVGTFLILAIGFLWIRRVPAVKRILDGIVLKIPVIKGIVQESNSARASRTLSSLLSSGVEVVQAIEITADVLPNTRFRGVLDLAKERIKKGEQLSVVFADHTDLYPVFVGEMINIGEETGKLAEMLGNVADYYEEEVSQKTKDLSTIIEPALMIVIGTAVGFFAVSILQPMYSIVNSI